MQGLRHDSADAHRTPWDVLRRLEIHRWRETETSEYTYTVEISHVEKFDDSRYVVTNHLEGDFPGGVVDIIYRFTLADGLITKLEIAP